MFAGSCIGVICLVISLEFLRRVQREYDRSISRNQHALALNSVSSGSSSSGQNLTEHGGAQGSKGPALIGRWLPQSGDGPRPSGAPGHALLIQQLLRALIHAVQFGVAYFIMLLAMYYNGEMHGATR